MYKHGQTNWKQNYIQNTAILCWSNHYLTHAILYMKMHTFQQFKKTIIYLHIYINTGNVSNTDKVNKITAAFQTDLCESLSRELLELPSD